MQDNTNYTTIPMTLFNMYKDNTRARLVFKKYNDGINSKYFASCICNLRSILAKPTSMAN